MSCADRPLADPLLRNHIGLLLDLDRSLPILDLACGTGRNGLALAAQGLSVVFADRSANALAAVQRRLHDSGDSGRVWSVDLEQQQANPLSGQDFAAIVCFRYLHRPLLPAIIEAVMPAGFVIYQTFTVDQAHFGRPYNPDYLLLPGELKAQFDRWEVIHYFEGVRRHPNCAVAQLVARKPASQASAAS